jgi:hypothetical protein
MHQEIRRGPFCSLRDPIHKIDSYVNYNTHKRPFAWTAAADSICAKLQLLTNIHILGSDLLVLVGILRVGHCSLSWKNVGLTGSFKGKLCD